ncbi:hypothetical protein NI447_04980 [Enterococcus lactis]|nr:hypothetical protein [Enterococcus lactis]
MSVELDATEVYKALREVKANVQRVESPALRKAGEYAQEKLRENTPYWDGKNRTANADRTCRNMQRITLSLVQ